MGGSDPMEVAALGKPLVVGPFTENFRLPVSSLAQADAIRVVQTAAELPGAIGRILEDRAAASALGSRAKETVRRNQGATERTATAIVSIARAEVS